MTLRELKYVILGDDKLSDKMQRISGASDKAKKALGEHSDKLGGLRRKYTEAAQAVPALGGAMEGVSSAMAGVLNPITLAAAAAVGLGLAFRKGIQEASMFELEFRKLENINLDKTTGQIDELRTKILGMSMQGGFDPGKISQGYFDIQSLTGKSGYGTEYTVSNQAKFARASGADANKYIAGTGVAMKNYGFGAGEIEAYNKSNMGLVATAKITYDQLAEVSSMYAGPAAAANQSFNSANKLMAMFTAKTKSAEEAATLTKSAFTDLFKKSTIDSFKSIGIDMYDMSGNAKQIDQILLELNKKFADRTSARSMDELRNKFQGSEGINALLSAAKDQSGALLQSFNDFDKAGGGLQKMLESSKKDINILNDEVNGKLKTAWVSLGEAVLPAWIQIKELVSASISGIAEIMKSGYWGSSRSANAAVEARANNAKSLEEKYKAEMGVVGMAKQLTPQQFMDSQKYYQQEYMNASSIVSKSQGDYVDIEAAKNKMNVFRELSTSLQTAYMAPAAKTGQPDPNATGGNGDSNIKSGLAGVSGGGTRNVTVTFKNLVENFTVQTTNITDGSGKIKTDIEEMLVSCHI